MANKNYFYDTIQCAFYENNPFSPRNKETKLKKCFFSTFHIKSPPPHQYRQTLCISFQQAFIVDLYQLQSYPKHT